MSANCKYQFHNDVIIILVQHFLVFLFRYIRSWKHFVELKKCRHEFARWHLKWFIMWIFCRWCFDVELVFLCKHFGIPMLEISVNWSEIPGSKVNPLSIPYMLWELVLMSVGYRTGMWRIRTWVITFEVNLARRVLVALIASILPTEERNVNR